MKSKDSDALMDKINDAARVQKILHFGNYYMNAQDVCDVIRKHESYIKEQTTKDSDNAS